MNGKNQDCTLFTHVEGVAITFQRNIMMKSSFIPIALATLFLAKPVLSDNKHYATLLRGGAKGAPQEGKIAVTARFLEKDGDQVYKSETYGGGADDVPGVYVNVEQTLTGGAGGQMTATSTIDNGNVNEGGTTGGPNITGVINSALVDGTSNGGSVTAGDININVVVIEIDFSCMSGETGVYRKKQLGDDSNDILGGSATPSFAVAKVVDLVPGDIVRGMDRNQQVVEDCKVLYVGDWGTGTLYGNYTSDHFLYDYQTGIVREHGAVGTGKSGQRKYTLMTTCPFVLDEVGNAFSPLDSDVSRIFSTSRRRRLGLGSSDVTSEFTLKEYYLLYDAAVAFSRILAPIVPNFSIYRPEVLLDGELLAFDASETATNAANCILWAGSFCGAVREEVLAMAGATFTNEVAEHITSEIPEEPVEIQKFLKEHAPPSYDKYISLLELIGAS